MTQIRCKTCASSFKDDFSYCPRCGKAVFEPKIENLLDELLTINQAADRIHVSRETIYQWIKQGKLHPIKTPGGRFRIPVRQLTVE